MKLTIDVKNDEQVAGQIDQLGDRARNPQPALARAGHLLEAGIQRQFSTRGGEFGGGWPGTADLKDTGAMYGSLFTRVAKTQVTVGLKDYKARFHQGGTERGLPKRELVGRSRTTEVHALEIMQDYLLGGL